jgi:hypothetical protein
MLDVFVHIIIFLDAIWMLARDGQDSFNIDLG